MGSARHGAGTGGGGRGAGQDSPGKPCTLRARAVVSRVPSCHTGLRAHGEGLKGVQEEGRCARVCRCP